VTKLLAHWVLSALCLLLVARFVPGFFVKGFGTALIAAVVVGFVNATLGSLLKIVTFPLTILTFGVFWLLINGLMLKFATLFVPGFEVRGVLARVLGCSDTKPDESDYPPIVEEFCTLAWKIHDFGNTEGLAMVQIRCSHGFETKNEAFA
jgi:putative membrane protein